MTDVIFYVDAVPETGFGHGARCLFLAGIIVKQNPRTTIAFRGKFSSGAMSHLLSAWPDLDIGPPREDEIAKLGVIDRMADPMDMNATDDGYNSMVAAACRKVVYIASGVVAPTVPDHVVVVGYQPGAQKPGANILWSLDYAPTDLVAPTGPRQKVRLLIALGGNKGGSWLDKAITAAARVRKIHHIDVLLSPVAEEASRDGRPRDDQEISWHQNVADVAPLINAAGVVMASTGNLAYEAMALGAPVCLVGQKAFQVELADVMATRGMAVSAGLLEEILADQLAHALRSTMDQGDSLGAQASRLVHLNGLRRLADVIISHGELS